MKTSEEIKAACDKNLNHEKVSDLELTENQKNQLKVECVKFVKSQKEQLENFINKNRTYIEDLKHQTMTQYLVKLIDESDMSE